MSADAELVKLVRKYGLPEEVVHEDRVRPPSEDHYRMTKEYAASYRYGGGATVVSSRAECGSYSWISVTIQVIERAHIDLDAIEDLLAKAVFGELADRFFLDASQSREGAVKWLTGKLILTPRGEIGDVVMDGGAQTSRRLLVERYGPEVLVEALSPDEQAAHRVLQSYSDRRAALLEALPE